MAATAVADVSTGAASSAARATTLRLPAGTKARAPKPAQVLVLDNQPKAHVTSDQDAADARHAAAHRREWESRERARIYLHQVRTGDPGTDGEAMLARPERDTPLSFILPDAIEASLARCFADSHLIDQMWNRGQLNDWKYAAANRALELFNEAGLDHSAVAGVGRSGAGIAEMSDAMARARGLWNRLLSEMGYPADELLTCLCQGRLAIQGQAARAEALEVALSRFARHYGIEKR